MIKRVSTLFAVISLSLAPSFAALVQKSGAEYLQGYLNEGMDPAHGFRCQKDKKLFYLCSLKDYHEEGESGSFAAKSMILRFDAKTLEPVLNEGTFTSFLKNREVSERIDREVDNKKFQNGIQERMYRKRLEKKYFYDSKIESEVSKRLLLGLKRAEAKDVYVKDLNQSSQFYAETILYTNDLTRAVKGIGFDYPVLGKAALEFKKMDFYETLSQKDFDERALKQWQTIRSVTPSPVKVIDRERFVRLMKKLNLLNGSGVKSADASIVLENEPVDAESIMSTLYAWSKEPKKSSSTLNLQIRFDHVGSLLDEKSASPSKPDFMFKLLKIGIKAEPEYLKRYRSLLNSDSAFKEDSEAFIGYISDLFRYYADTSDNRDFKVFLKRSELILTKWLRGESKGFGLSLKNRDDLTFSDLVGKLLFKTSQTDDKKSTKERVIEFIFENFAVELYEE